MYNKELSHLTARLPELAWQLNKIDKPILPNLLPPGLFKSCIDVPASFYIDEIKTDIERMKKSRSDAGERYLASKIQQKITVLVSICDKTVREKKTPASTDFSVKAIVTRQQWLQSLEATIKSLTEQRDALINCLAQKDSHENIQLNCYSELGLLEKRLTLAKETYAKSVSC